MFHLLDVGSPLEFSCLRLSQGADLVANFTNFRDLTILQGRPSLSFTNAWKTWNKSRSRGKKSEFPDPGKKASYDETQLWAIVEMQDAGTDCERLMENGMHVENSSVEIVPFHEHGRLENFLARECQPVVRNFRYARE